ncbi:MAG: hypothetical protein WD669_00825 [Pirellulales bacterium]
MPYRVFWAPAAEQKLEQAIQLAADASVIVAAAREVERRLIGAPYEFGESRSDPLRVGFVLPLGIMFEIMDDVRTVIVHDAWTAERK